MRRYSEGGPERTTEMVTTEARKLRLIAKGHSREQVHGRRRREERWRTKSAAGDARRAKLPAVAGSGGRRRWRPQT